MANISEANMASLRLFNAVIECPGEVEPIENKDAIHRELFAKHRVLVHPDASYAIQEIRKFINSTRLTAEQLNSTFFRSWTEVMEKSETELKIQQFLHYITTFYCDFQSEFVYIPADAVPLEIEAPKEGWKLNYIGSLPQNVVLEKCMSLIKNGTALSDAVIKDIALICLDYLQIDLPLDDVRNRSVKVLLIAKKIQHKIPVKCGTEDLLKAVFYVCTSNTILIKNKNTLDLITRSHFNVKHLFLEHGPEKLATIFNRYKLVFIALKKANEENRQVINYISKLSKEYHIPMPLNPMSALCWRYLNVDSEKHWLENATVAAKIRALNACKMAISQPEYFMYRIRNGKVWITRRVQRSKDAAKFNFELILDDLKKSLGPKFADKVIYIPKGIEYGLPVSELQMLGNIPFGTKISMDTKNHIAFGIYWNTGYRCTLLDLSALTTEGLISWCTKFKTQYLAHSGDMTALGKDGATEYILSSPVPEGYTEEVLLSMNCWTGNKSDYECDIIIGTNDNIDKQYMLNPANLITNFRYKATKAGCDIGYLERDTKQARVIISPGASSSSVSKKNSDEERSRGLMTCFKHTLHHSLTLNELLELLGARLVDTPEVEVDIDLGLDKINKDFFNLFI